jgi:hypothetical protein
MPRQPNAGAGAAVRSPSGAAARAAAPSPSSLPPERYRALRARYNALLATLYERTSLTQREIAAAAGRTERAVQVQVRRLGCLPRNARMCRPGTDVGPRRAGERLPPLNGPATRRTVEALAAVARELAASAQARSADDLQRATVRATHRSAQAQRTVMTSAARRLSQVAAAMESTAAARETLAAPPKRKAGRSGAAKPARDGKPPWWANRHRIQERARYQMEAAVYDAHARRRAEQAERLAAASARDAEADRRIDRAAERFEAEQQQRRPRIRGL